MVSKIPFFCIVFDEIPYNKEYYELKKGDSKSLKNHKRFFLYEEKHNEICRSSRFNGCTVGL